MRQWESDLRRWSVTGYRGFLQYVFVCLCAVCVAVQLLDVHLGNRTGRRTATMTAPLRLTNGPVMYETLLQLWDKPGGGTGTNL